MTSGSPGNFYNYEKVLDYVRDHPGIELRSGTIAAAVGSTATNISNALLAVQARHREFQHLRRGVWQWGPSRPAATSATPGVPHKAAESEELKLLREIRDGITALQAFWK